MSTYDVYGMGNALVDIEVEISDTQLNQMSVEKGLMTLIDTKRQQQLMAAFGNLHPKMACGGSAANTLIALAQLGGRGYYNCMVANDETGSFYLRDLANHNIDTNFSLENRPQGITGKCLVMITPDADRTMNTALNISASIGPNQLAPKALATSDYLYIEGYFVSVQKSFELAIAAKTLARSRGVKVALTTSDPSMVKYFKAQFLDLLGDDGVDLLFCNKEEALLLSDTTNLDAACPKLQKIAPLVAITQGKQGAVILHRGKQHQISATQTTAIDTTGAGDMFAGAFLYGLTQNWSLARSGQLASRACAKIVSQFGPRLSKADIEALNL